MLFDRRQRIFICRCSNERAMDKHDRMLGYSDNRISGCSQASHRYVSVCLLNAAKSTASVSVIRPFTGQIGRWPLYAIIPSRAKNHPRSSGDPFSACFSHFHDSSSASTRSPCRYASEICVSCL